jgi:phosphoribosylformylglycinamidine cyclo-ligase
VFGWLSRAGGMDEAEMLRTFNCGVGMIAVVPEESADAVASLLTAQGEGVSRLGRLVPRTGAGVVFRGAVRW